MESRTVGIEDALFSALLGVYMVSVFPDPQTVDALILVLCLTSAVASIGLYSLCLQLAFVEARLGFSSEESWRLGLGLVSTDSTSILLPIEFNLARPDFRWEIFIPLPIIMTFWLIIRIWAWPHDTNGNGKPPPKAIASAIVVIVQTAGVGIVYVAFHDITIASVPRSSLWLVYAAAIVLEGFLFFLTREMLSERLVKLSGGRQV